MIGKKTNYILIELEHTLLDNLFLYFDDSSFYSIMVGAIDADIKTIYGQRKHLLIKTSLGHNMKYQGTPSEACYIYIT